MTVTRFENFKASEMGKARWRGRAKEKKREGGKRGEKRISSNHLPRLLLPLPKLYYHTSREKPLRSSPWFHLFRNKKERKKEGREGGWKEGRSTKERKSERE